MNTLERQEIAKHVILIMILNAFSCIVDVCDLICVVLQGGRGLSNFLVGNRGPPGPCNPKF